MDTLQAMRVFARVVEAGGFARAGDLTGLGTPTVSRLIQTLEIRLGCRLLNRTTRRIALTDDGRTYYERCINVLNEIDDIEASLSHAKVTPRGRVKVNVPPAMGKSIVIPALPAFAAQYPEILVEIGLTDRLVDLVGEAVDCVVRVGALEDSGLVARRIGTMAPCTCATPAYLERYGVPETLDALDRHVGVNYTSMNTGKTRPWCFMDGGKPKTVAMKGIVSVNDADAYVASVLAGLGLGKTSRYLVDPHLKTGALQRVLSRFDEPARPVSILYLPNRNLPHKVRVFIDWLSGVFEKQEALQQSGEG